VHRDRSEDRGSACGWARHRPRRYKAAPTAGSVGTTGAGVSGPAARTARSDRRPLVDPTPAGELVANVVMAVAQWERRRIAERTRAAMATAQARGRHLGRSSTVPTEVRARIREERAAARSLNAIAAGLNADNIPTGQGGASWDHSSVRAVLRSIERDRPGLSRSRSEEVRE
jgi:Resolvase, N terminal domain/Recombinase